MPDLAYTPNDRWEQLPGGYSHRDVAGVATNSSDQVFVFTRHEGQVLVYEPDGTFVKQWGLGTFTRPHAITIAPDDSVYLVDDVDCSVKKYAPDGELLMTLGTPGQPSDTGYVAPQPVDVHAVEGVRYPGPPFNRCTDIAIAPNGDLYVSDGYRNCRIHRFSSDGELLHSWGEIGVGPGEFHLPHAICVTPDDRVVVADRENDRLQIFDLDGKFLEEWTDTTRPCGITVDGDGLIYVAELWRPKGKKSFVHGAADPEQPGRVTIFDGQGRLRSRWGASADHKNAAGNFIAPHSIAVDSRGDIYVGEVTYTFALAPGWVPEDYAGHQLQKFVRAE